MVPLDGQNRWPDYAGDTYFRDLDVGPDEIEEIWSREGICIVVEMGRELLYRGCWVFSED